MPALSDYTAGTITLTNGSTAFTGVGTGWQAADFREGDTIFQVQGQTQWEGVVLTIDSNTSGFLVEPWGGATGTYAYRMRYMADGARVTAQARNLIELLGNGNIQAFAALVGPGVPVFNGPHAMIIKPEADFINGVTYDVQVDTLADRSAYDGQTAGFVVLVSNLGDGRAAIYSKNSNTSGDWSDPAYITGPSITLTITEVDEVPYGTPPDVTLTPIAGGYNMTFDIPRGMTIVPGATTTIPPGQPAAVTFVPITGGYRLDFAIPSGEGFSSAGNYNSGTAYFKGDVVLNLGSSWIATQATTGNVPPTLPITSNAYWQLLARAGIDGAGTVSSITAGSGLVIDNSDPTIPKISYSGVLPCGRPSLVSGVAVPTADVVNATTIYYVPSTGNNLVPVYDATLGVMVARSIGNQLSLALDPNPVHFLYQAVNMFDLLVIWDGVTAKLCSSFPWVSEGGSNIARGVGINSAEIEEFNGVWVNKNSTWVRFGNGESDIVEIAPRTATLVGSFFAIGAGLVSDSAENRLLASAYNPALRRLRRQDTGVWTNTTAAFGSANGNAYNRVAVVSCLSGTHVSLQAISMAYNSTETERSCGVAIANSNDVIPAECAMGWFGTIAAPSVRTGFASYEGQPGLGIRNLKWFERANGTDTQTFFGSSDQSWHTGLVGTVLS